MTEIKQYSTEWCALNPDAASDYINQLIGQLVILRASLSGTEQRAENAEHEVVRLREALEEGLTWTLPEEKSQRWWDKARKALAATNETGV